jgi:hypothetical protein
MAALIKNLRFKVCILILLILIILIGLISSGLRALATNEQMEPKYIVCRPMCGIIDKISVIKTCLDYAIKFNRVLIIDTSTDYFNDDINEYINIHSPHVYTGSADSILPKIMHLSIYPPNTKLKPKYTEEDKKMHLSYEVKSLDLSKDYSETILFYTNCKGHSNTSEDAIELLKMSTFNPKVLDIYKSRRAQLPENYVGLHIRNTDYKSNVPEFIESHKDVLMNQTIFLASDNKNTIDEFKEIFGDRLITFANIPDNNGKPIHEGYERTKEESREYNIDTFVDILLLANATNYYYSHKTSGFSISIADLRKQPNLLKKLVE